MTFMDGYKPIAKCQYCNSDIEYKGLKSASDRCRGYVFKKCPSCNKNNGLSINIKGQLVSFKGQA